MSLSVAAGEESIRCECGTPVVLIGSRRDCHLPLAHPDVSKLHCAVVNTGKAILVRDLLSRSGTFVNDELIRTALLRPGDTVRVGPVQVNVEFPDAVGAPPPAADPDGADPLRFATPVVLDTGGKRIEITHNVTVIGRRKSADMVIDTPDVSLAHALVFMLDGHPVVCDLGSRSGTFRNGERVELAWLNDGDELGIGGEKLTVRWTGAMVAAARPAERPEPANAEGLSELERTIATVQTQVSTTWTQIDERELQLDQREAELKSQFAQLARRYDALAQAEAALQRRETDAKAAEARARENLASTGQCEQSLTRERAELDELTKHLTNQRKAQEAQQAELAEQQARLDDTNTTLARQRNDLNEQIEACSRGEKELQQRAKEMDQRDSALSAREAAAAATDQRITQLKSALQQAGELFASSQDTSAPTQTPPASGDDLPAPMVQQPLFAPGKSQPPSDWPAELHKRFRVLRRVSSKTNEELLAQIWAEREKIRASQR